MSKLRLRQICLIAPQLEPAVDALRQLFAIEVCYRDPLLATWGVENAMLPVGAGFLEVCVPIREDAPAARYLSRHPEGGGYIVIFNCSDLDRRRDHLKQFGIRIVTDLAHEAFRTLQLHPGDVGGCMVEFNTTTGGAGAHNPFGPYAPAGPAWAEHIRTDRVREIAAVEIRTNAPRQLAAHWAAIMEAPLAQTPDGMPCIVVDDGEIRFVPAASAQREGLSAIELQTSGEAASEAILAAAAARHLPVSGRAIRLMGVEFRLRSSSSR